MALAMVMHSFCPHDNCVPLSPIAITRAMLKDLKSFCLMRKLVHLMLSQSAYTIQEALDKVSVDITTIFLSTNVSLLECKFWTEQL